ncbi:MAG: hypothetical protein JWQ03_1637 [Variovorax sp.]|nr:hypothetical protein [Variovorax sp.]
MLTGDEQRSPTPLKSCPKSFVVTEAMVQWANRDYPILSLEDLKKETRAFRNNRFKVARIEWVPTWENWIKTAAETKAKNARPSLAGTYQTARQQHREQRMREAAGALPSADLSTPLTLDAEEPTYGVPALSND